MLYLVEKTFDGEPIGIWTDAGTSYYIPGHESEQGTASGIVSNKGTELPWSVWVDQLTSKIGHRRWWDEVDTSAEMPEALDTAREKYFSLQSNQTAVDH